MSETTILVLLYGFMLYCTYDKLVYLFSGISKRVSDFIKSMAMNIMFKENGTLDDHVKNSVNVTINICRLISIIKAICILKAIYSYMTLTKSFEYFGLTLSFELLGTIPKYSTPCEVMSIMVNICVGEYFTTILLVLKFLLRGPCKGLVIEALKTKCLQMTHAYLIAELKSRVEKLIMSWTDDTDLFAMTKNSFNVIISYVDMLGDTDESWKWKTELTNSLKYFRQATQPIIDEIMNSLKSGNRLTKLLVGLGTLIGVIVICCFVRPTNTDYTENDLLLSKLFSVIKLLIFIIIEQKTSLMEQHILPNAKSVHKIISNINLVCQFATPAVINVSSKLIEAGMSGMVSGISTVVTTVKDWFGK